MIIRKFAWRDIAIALVAGLAAPPVLLVLRVAIGAFTGARVDRINAFLAPGAYRLRPVLAVLCMEAALGLVVGAVVGALLARFARGRFALVWWLFACAFVASLLLLPGSVPLLERIGVLFRQPMIACALLAAWLGPWLIRRWSSRGAAADAAR